MISKYKKIALVAGARPNFMKIAPLFRAFKKLPPVTRPKLLLVHTGQHYDHQMSQVFFNDLSLPKPDVYLGVRSRIPASQTAEIIRRFALVLSRHKPDLVIVVGDVTSTPAAALAARIRGIPVAHVEAGLRSFDPSMPEEANRILTDHLSDLLFAPSQDAVRNLLNEGIEEGKVHFAGNVMIDSLKDQISKTGNRRPGTANQKPKEPYVLLTLHRPGNVDDRAVLGGILQAMAKISKEAPVLFPAHPRTAQKLEAGRLKRVVEGSLHILSPLGYSEFLELEKNAACVFTDSGGVQEETSFLGVPCITIRKNTERPVTIGMGTNCLAGVKQEGILKAWRETKTKYGILKTKKQKSKNIGMKIPKWDGKAAERIVRIIINKQ
jgi:UDP-N-acetylglucosamine 2-epimerase (non-hydrolysing)